MKITHKVYSADMKEETTIAATEFANIASAGTHFRFVGGSLRTLYPYSGEFIEYRYTTADGTEKCFERTTFFALLKRERAYKKFCKNNDKAYHANLYWFEDEGSGLIAMLAPTPANKQISDFNRRDRDNTAKHNERDTRCRFDDGTVCYKPCIGCEQQGERQSTFISYDILISNGYETEEMSDPEIITMGELLIGELREALTDEEYGLVEALMNGHTLRSYVNEIAETTPALKENTLYQRLYRMKPTAIAKAKAVLNSWQ